MRIEKAYAKINTYLNVISKRSDGYHNIVSVMQTVSLCDLVCVELFDADTTQIELHIIGNDALTSGSDNLAWRAATAFLKKANKVARVRIRIEKNIPMSAGLAGGSADAAAVLRALYALCGAPFPISELYTLGETLGADVPFCIRGGCCLVKGIGNELCEAPTMPSGHLVIARMGDGVSTPAAYGALDLKYGDFSTVSEDLRYLEILETWKKGDLTRSCESFFNLFEEVVAENRPLVSHLKSVMLNAGAIRAMMSGSGPSVFGVFPNAETAQAAHKRLCGMGAVAFLCAPCEGYRFP